MKKSAKKSVGWAKKGKITEKLQKKLWSGGRYTSLFVTTFLNLFPLMILYYV